MKPQNCLGPCPQHFLGFTQALAFPVGSNGSLYVSSLAGMYPILIYFRLVRGVHMLQLARVYAWCTVCTSLHATADSFTSVLDGVARHLNVDDALNLADQVVTGMYCRH